MQLLFWCCSALIIYAYAGYPLLLWLLCQLKRAPITPATHYEPTVTLLISAFNEAAVIEAKLHNSLKLDYPSAKLEIIVISDASEDATDTLVTNYAAQGVKLLRMQQRGGKTLGINAGVQQAQGEIIIFSDANALYAQDALRMLVRHFDHAEIGAVVGESSYTDNNGGAQENESLYWRYETTIKRLETQLGSIVGGDGAIYAIRRNLYRPMRADALSDFVNPMQIVMQGHRCVFEPQARSVEEAAADFNKEFRRKVRIVNRAWRALWSMPTLLNPFKYGFFALEVISHKLLRWLVPIFLTGVLGATLQLASQAAVYALAGGAQLLLYSCAVVGYLLRRRINIPKLFAIPYYFCLVNYASMHGIFEAFRGKTYTTWTTARTY